MFKPWKPAQPAKLQPFKPAQPAKIVMQKPKWEVRLVKTRDLISHQKESHMGLVEDLCKSDLLQRSHFGKLLAIQCFDLW